MRRISRESRVRVLAALCEGASINATERQTGVSKVTILKLLADVGNVVLDYQRRILVNLPCKRVQCDEIWSFVQCKERLVPRDEKGRGRGDAWTWTAVCEDTNLIPCWHVGARDAEAARLFMEDLASRLANRVQLTTDGLKAYIEAVDSAFGSSVDYAMLVKLYGPSMDGPRRYSPAECVGVQKERITGNPDMELASTSFVEAHNMSMRTNIRRLTRLTNGHSKKIENHIHAMALWFMYYNFCRKHSTLTQNAGGIHTTPAMAAGISDHVWKVEEIVALLETSEK